MLPSKVLALDSTQLMKTFLEFRPTIKTASNYLANLYKRMPFNQKHWNHGVFPVRTPRACAMRIFQVLHFAILRNRSDHSVLVHDLNEALFSRCDWSTWYDKETEWNCLDLERPALSRCFVFIWDNWNLDFRCQGGSFDLLSYCYVVFLKHRAVLFWELFRLAVLIAVRRSLCPLLGIKKYRVSGLYSESISGKCSRFAQFDFSFASETNYSVEHGIKESIILFE